jgi:hypothetical protein
MQRRDFFSPVFWAHNESAIFRASVFRGFQKLLYRYGIETSEKDDVLNGAKLTGGGGLSNASI